MTRFHWLTIALLSTVAVSCTDKHPTAPPPPPPPGEPPPPPPVPPGSAVVALVTPNNDDGAVSITLRGPAISSLQTASSGYIFYSRLVGDTVARVIVLGNVTAGPIFTFKVASGSVVPGYHATIDQIANRANALRASTANYSLTIAAP